MSVKRALRSSASAACESTKPQIIGSSSNSQVGKPLTRQTKRSVVLDEKHRHELMKPENHAIPRNVEEPSTPPLKRAKLCSPSPPPEISTHAQTEVEKAMSYEEDDKFDVVPFDRPAEPHRTNAPLKTPRGSRLLTYPKEIADSSPSKTGVPRPTTTTGHMLEEACAHLIKADQRLRPLIEKHHCRIFSSEGLAEEIDPFHSLCSGIMAQQVSGSAAKAIKNRFVGLFQQAPAEVEVHKEGSFPTPAQVAACEVVFLRQAGLSGRKAEYIKGLAEKFTSGELSAAMLIRASDEEVLERLTAVRGLGKWSVEMFSCFGLKRMDVLSTGDLGVQ